MSGYDQFFKTAHQVRKGEVKTPPFKIKKNATVEADPVEDRLRKALKVEKKPRAKFPWSAAIVLSLCLAAIGFYLVAPQKIEDIFGKIEILPMGEAIAEESQAAEKSKQGVGEKEKAASDEDKNKTGQGSAKAQSVTEDLSHFEKLKERKEALDLREKELAELEEELQRQKVELEKRLAQLESMRSEISAALKDRVEVDQEKVNKLVELYTNMKPKQASDIIGSLNDDLAVEILAKMKKKSAAEIMNLLPAEKARALSEKYTGYRRRVAGQ